MYRNKNIILKIILFIKNIIFFIFITKLSFAQDKIAVVNINKILQKLPQIALIEKNIENEFKNRAKFLKNEEQSIQKKIKKFKKDNSLIKNIDKIKIENEIIKKKEKFIKQLKKFEKDNNQRNLEEKNKMLSKIQNEVNKIAIKEGFEIIMDANAIIFSIPSKDITDTIFKKVK